LSAALAAVTKGGDHEPEHFNSPESVRYVGARRIVRLKTLLRPSYGILSPLDDLGSASLGHSKKRYLLGVNAEQRATSVTIVTI
jgi:hypothetical protein